MYEAHRRADIPTLWRYFKRPYLETITKETKRLEHWLVAVSTLYEEEAKTDGSIRKILDDQGVHIDELHQITQAEEQPSAILSTSCVWMKIVGMVGLGYVSSIMSRV